MSTIIDSKNLDGSNLCETPKNKLDELNKIREQSLQGGGKERIEQQHAKGKLTARERINLLLDKGSFEEIGSLVTHHCKDLDMDKKIIHGDSVITGFGTINNKTVFVYAQDFTVFGGTVSEASAQKICRIMDMAVESGSPIIGLLDSGGARIQEGVDSLIGCGEIFFRNTIYSGIVPQISVIMGPCAGAAVYSPALTDFIFIVNKTGQMSITGPAVIKAATGEEVNPEEYSGAHVQASKAGNCHFIANSEEECLQMVRHLLTFIPQNNRDTNSLIDKKEITNCYLGDEILHIVPSDPNKSYDMKKIILKIADNKDFMEIQEKFGQSIITGFARIGGKNVGIVAQQPLNLAGALTVNASDKAARFVRFCDCFNIPIITFVDVPGYMPGVDQENQGIIRHGAKLLYAYAEATTIKISIIIRKAYGGAFVAMSSKSLRSDINYAWPTAELAVMGPEGAVNILYRNIISNAENGDEIKRRLINDYISKFANPYNAASKGYIDDVIDPRETKIKIINALKILENKISRLPHKKHGNIPL